MKKKLVFVVLLLLFLKYFPTGSSNYKMRDTDVSLFIPRLSFLKDECCMHAASFISFKPAYYIKNELEKMLVNLEKISCNNHDYYYDSKKNVSIVDYEIKKGILYNEFYINYIMGNEGKYQCGRIQE